MAWTTARERVSAAALPITYSATEGSPNEAMLILPVPTAKTVSPSNGVWVGLIARASPSSAIWAIFVAWVFVSSTFVATTAIVVFLSRPPGTAAGLDILGGGPPWIGMRLPNSSASSSGAAYRLPLASNVEPSLHAAGDGAGSRSDIALLHGAGLGRAARREAEGGIWAVGERGAAPSRVEEDRARNDRHDVAPAHRESDALTLQTLHDPAGRRQTVGAPSAQRDGVDDLDHVLRLQQVGLSRPGRSSALTHPARHALAALLGNHDSRAGQRMAREVANLDAGHVGDGVIGAGHLGPAG